MKAILPILFLCSSLTVYANIPSFDDYQAIHEVNQEQVIQEIMTENNELSESTNELAIAEQALDMDTELLITDDVMTTEVANDDSLYADSLDEFAGFSNLLESNVCTCGCGGSGVCK